jgi:hypothetical protein
MVSYPLVILISALGFVAIMVTLSYSFQDARAPVIDPCASPKQADTSEVSKNITKLERGFYDRIVCLMDNGIDRKYSVMIIVPRDSENKTVAQENKILLIEALENKHNAENVNAGTILSFVTAEVPIREILKLVDYEFVGIICDGEKSGHLANEINN